MNLNVNGESFEIEFLGETAKDVIDSLVAISLTSIKALTVRCDGDLEVFEYLLQAFVDKIRSLPEEELKLMMDGGKYES